MAGHFEHNKHIADEDKYEFDGSIQLVLSKDTEHLMVIVQNEMYSIF